MREEAKKMKRKVKRARRVRARIFGTSARPRLAVFRSNRTLSVQLIDDHGGRTLAAASKLDIGKENYKKPKTEQAMLVGEALAKKAAKLGITSAVFDRRSYQYHGRVKACADAVRKHGIKI
ncbi:MAG: 50S ribosomal protein L18 [Candidatus Liptonbacteria bacterium]|nr:50S ribosomal protein L18 [Candidatus Liptonbacteria bacterium]